MAAVVCFVPVFSVNKVFFQLFAGFRLRLLLCFDGLGCLLFKKGWGEFFLRGFHVLPAPAVFPDTAGFNLQLSAMLQVV